MKIGGLADHSRNKWLSRLLHFTDAAADSHERQNNRQYSQHWFVGFHKLFPRLIKWSTTCEDPQFHGFVLLSEILCRILRLYLE